MNKKNSPQKKHPLSTRNIDVYDLGSAGLFVGQVHPNTIALVHSMAASEILNRANEIGLHHFIQSTLPHRIERITIAQKIITAGPSQVHNLPYNLLIHPPTVSQKFTFYRSADKNDLLNQVVALINKIKTGRRYADEARTIADEFFTNVLYNAFPGPGVKVSRNSEIILPKDKAGELYIGASNEELLIAVMDHFGTLDLDGLILRLKKTFSMGISRSISHSRGGAGIGCRLVLDRSQRFWIIVIDKMLTSFVSIRPIGSDARNLNLDYKDIHFLKFSE